MLGLWFIQAAWLSGAAGAHSPLLYTLWPPVGAWHCIMLLYAFLFILLGSQNTETGPGLPHLLFCYRLF